MGIFQRKNGYFYLRVNTPEGFKRISLETKDARLAKEIYQAYLLDKIKSKIISSPTPSIQSSSLPQESPPQKQSKPLSTCFTEYIKSCQAQNLSHHVMQAKNRLLKSLETNKIKTVSQINQEAINKLLNSWKTKGQDSLDRYVKDLKAFLNFCIKKRYYDRADYETLSFPSKSSKVRDIVISESDYQKLVQAVIDRDFSLYLKTLWETGCRPNEVTCLKKSDIDFAKGIGRVFQHKTKKYKTIYLTDELINCFSDINTEYIFEGYGRQREYYAKKFRDLREALGLNKEYCLYAFRHSFGTRMLNKTKDIHLVSKLLGHSDISITAKHYINRNADEIREKLLQAHQ